MSTVQGAATHQQVEPPAALLLYKGTWYVDYKGVWFAAMIQAAYWEALDTGKVVSIRPLLGRLITQPTSVNK